MGRYGGLDSPKAEQHKVLWNMIKFLPFLALYTGMAAAESEIDGFIFLCFV